jgi:hypothetical protein
MEVNEVQSWASNDPPIVVKEDRSRLGNAEHPKIDELPPLVTNALKFKADKEVQFEKLNPPPPTVVRAPRFKVVNAVHPLPLIVVATEVNATNPGLSKFVQFGKLKFFPIVRRLFAFRVVSPVHEDTSKFPPTVAKEGRINAGREVQFVNVRWSATPKPAVTSESKLTVTNEGQLETFKAASTVISSGAKNDVSSEQFWEFILPPF